MRCIVAPSIALVCAAAACGGAPSKTVSPDKPAESVPSLSHRAETREASAPDPVTEPECSQFFDHIAKLLVIERAQKPDGWRDEDAAAVRDEFHVHNMARCLKMPRSTLECTLRAETASSMREC